MAYAFTVDEKYYSSVAGASDAPGSINQYFTLADGVSGFGALITPSDVDVYNLGFLGPGTYKLDVDGYNWDYNNLYFGGVYSFGVIDATGNYLSTESFSEFSDIYFNLYSDTDVYAFVKGYSYQGTEYSIKYDYVGELPDNQPIYTYQLLFEGGNGDSIFDVGDTVHFDITVSDADGIASGPVSTWYLKDPADNTFSEISSTNDSYTFTENDVGKLLQIETAFIDGLGNYYNYPLLWSDYLINGYDNQPTYTHQLLYESGNGDSIFDVGDTVHFDITVSDADGIASGPVSTWYLKDPADNTFSEISSTNDSYTFTENDVGKLLQIETAFIDGLGNSYVYPLWWPDNLIKNMNISPDFTLNPTTHHSGVEVGYGNSTDGGATIKNDEILFDSVNGSFRIYVHDKKIGVQKLNDSGEYETLYEEISPEGPGGYGSIYNHTDLVTFDDGSFAIAWSAFSQYASGYGYGYVQFFDADGAPIGDKQQVFDGNSDLRWEQFTEIIPQWSGSSAEELSLSIYVKNAYQYETTVNVEVDNLVPSGFVSSLGIVNQAEAFSYQLLATDVDAGDVLTFQGVDLPDWLSVSETGLLTGTPSNDDVGSHTVTVEVSDGQGGYDQNTFSLFVNNINDPPLFEDPGTVYNYEDITLSYQLLAEDIDVGDNLTFESANLPDWLQLSSDGLLTGTPENYNVGEHNISVKVADNDGLTDQLTFNLVIQNTNDAPTIEIYKPQANYDVPTALFENLLEHYNPDSTDPTIVANFSNWGFNHKFLSIGDDTFAHVGEFPWLNNPVNGHGINVFSQIIDLEHPFIALSTHHSGVEVGYGNSTDGGATIKNDEILFDSVNGSFRIYVHDKKIGVQKLNDSGEYETLYEEISPEGPGGYGSIYNHTDLVTFDDGSFAIAWSAFSQYASGYGYGYVQFFDADGAPIGDKQQVFDGNSDLRWEQFTEIIPQWSGSSAEELSLSIYVKNAYQYETTVNVEVDNLVPLALLEPPLYPVEHYTGTHVPDIGQFQNGNIIVTFTGGHSNVNAKIIDPNGDTVVTEFEVGEGHHANVWTNADTAILLYPSPKTIHGEFFGLATVAFVNSLGEKINDDIQLEFAGWPGSTLDLIGLPDGTFVVSYARGDPRIDDTSGIPLYHTICLQKFDQDFSPIGSPTIVYESDTELHHQTNLFLNSANEIVVAFGEWPETGELAAKIEVYNFNLDKIGLQTQPNLQHPDESWADIFINESGQLSKFFWSEEWDDQSERTFLLSDSANLAFSGGLTIEQDAQFYHQLWATDVDAGDVLTFQGVDLPDWLSVSETGLLTGTPSNDDVGSHTVTVEVVDAAGAKDQATFSITVNNVNDNPVFDTIPAVEADEDENFTYQLLATDVDAGDVLTFQGVELPDWLDLKIRLILREEVV